MTTFPPSEIPTTTNDPLPLYLTLDEVNKAIPAVSFSTSQLATLGFPAVKGSEVSKQLDDPDAARRYRSAMLYLRDDLPRIRAAIAASMQCGQGEAFSVGDLIAQAQQDLPPGYAMRIEVSQAGISLKALYPDATVPMPVNVDRSLSSCIKTLIQCANADAATHEAPTEAAPPAQPITPTSKTKD